MTTQNQTKTEQLKTYRETVRTCLTQERDLLDQLEIIKANKIGAEAAISVLEGGTTTEVEKKTSKRGRKPADKTVTGAAKSAKKGAKSAAKAATKVAKAAAKTAEKAEKKGKQAAKVAKKAAKQTAEKGKGKGKKAAAEGGKYDTLRYRIALALGEDTCNADEVVARMKKAGTLPPNSDNPKPYIQMTLSTTKDLFERPGRGQYKNKAAVVKELRKLAGDKPAKAAVKAKATNGKSNKASNGAAVDEELSGLGNSVVDNPFSSQSASE